MFDDEIPLTGEECARCCALEAAARLHVHCPGSPGAVVLAESIARWLAEDEAAAPLRQAAVRLVARFGITGQMPLATFMAKAAEFARFLERPTVEPASPPRKLRRVAEIPEAS